MKQVIDTSELINRFNTDEAVWRSYECKRALRRKLEADSLLPEEVLVYLDWLEAEQENSMTWCVGKLIQ
jgi:hypothetical protein